MFDDMGTQVKPTRPPTDPERPDLHLADREGHGDPDRASWPTAVPAGRRGGMPFARAMCLACPVTPSDGGPEVDPNSGARRAWHGRHA